jgi:S1-C subfamily serine protease
MFKITLQLILFLFFTANSYAVTWVGSLNSQGSTGGANPKTTYTTGSGYWSRDQFDFPSCQKLNYNFSNNNGALRQGAKYFYLDQEKKTMHSSQIGIFDCKINPNGQIFFSLTEGVTRFTNPNMTNIIYKKDSSFSYIYSYANGTWTKGKARVDYNEVVTADNRSPMNQQEIELAKKMVIFYDGLNLHSSSTPYYGDRFPVYGETTRANAIQSKPIEQEKEKSKGSSGTAFFVNNNGYLITNHHVIKDCQNKSKVIFNRETIPAQLIAVDAGLDLALLKIDLKNKNFIKISGKDPQKLQRIIAAGYPLQTLSRDLKFTSGIISSLKGFDNNSNQIQIDAALNSGVSGGPIVDEKTGELIAVAVGGFKSEKIQSVNYGIKSASVLAFLKSNGLKEPLSMRTFSSSSNEILQLLEESTVLTYCMF